MMAIAVIDEDGSTTALSTAPAAAEDDKSDDEITRLRGEIAIRRQRLDSSLNQLGHRVSEDLDWRRQVAAHPWMVLAGAALVGFAIGRLTGPRRPATLLLHESEPV